MARTLKRHDTADPITGTAQVQDSDPESPTFGQLIPADLTVFETVELHGKLGETLIGGAVAEANADGTWVYEQTNEDVSLQGAYDLELECTLANGKKVHFPNSKAANEKLTVDEDLDDA